MISLTLLGFFSLLSGTTGCASPDYGLNNHDDVGAELDWIELADRSTLQVSFDAAFQRQAFTQNVGRCQVQVAFLLEYEDDGMGESVGGSSGEDNEEERPRGPTASRPQSHGTLTVVEVPHGQGPQLPTEPGACVLSTYNYDEPAPGEEGRSEEGEAGPSEGETPQGPYQGAWLVRGSIDFGEAILLTGPDDDVWLDRSEDDEGRVFYELLECDEDSFPFGQTLDLEVPGQVGDGPGEFTMAEVFATGPQMEMIRPMAELADGNILLHETGRHLPLAWEVLGDVPQVRGEEVAEEKMIWFQTTRLEDRRFEEALACLPFEGVEHFLIPREWFQQMTANDPSLEDPIYETGFQVDLKHRTQPISLGMIELGRVSSTVTEGGILHLEQSHR